MLVCWRATSKVATRGNWINWLEKQALWLAGHFETVVEKRSSIMANPDRPLHNNKNNNNNIINTILTLLMQIHSIYGFKTFCQPWSRRGRKRAPSQTQRERKVSVMAAGCGQEWDMRLLCLSYWEDEHVSGYRPAANPTHVQMHTH